jgi:PAS domain-containing protein
VSVTDLSSATVPSAGAGGQPAAPKRSWLTRPFRWLVRPRRILLLLSAIWIINVFDLGYTLLESLNHDFVEMNPVAAQLIGTSPEALVGYKSALLIVSSAILLANRYQRLTELGCWFLLVAYLYVGLCWAFYFEQRLVCLEDPAINVDPLIGCYIP